MINIHLNGDIVRCPDIQAIQKRSQELKDAHYICRYNIQESECETWKQSVSEWQKFNGIHPRCKLGGCDICPGHLSKKQLGNTEKSYKIDNVTYRKISSSAHYLVKESKSKTLFLTLTFPEFKRSEYNHLLILTESERNTCLNEVNKCFSKFVENLRTNYNCEGYIAVREFGSLSGRVHYHLLCSMPFVPFVKLNAAWCAAISDIAIFARNAVQTDRKTKFVENPTRAMRYVCKYFSKCKGQRSGTRLIFMSNNILQRPKSIYNESVVDILKGYKGIYINQTSDYTTCYRITNQKSFDQFCSDFLYPFFELSAGKGQGLSHIRPKNSDSS